MTTGHHGKAFHGGGHYENFPVGSWLVPGPMRQSVLALYRFARTGDDLADEGQRDRTARHAGLKALLSGLTREPWVCTETTGLATELESCFFIGAALRDALDTQNVSGQPAQDLIFAFAWDIDHAPMRNESEVLLYCSKSANPVGRLVLGFAGLAHPEESANHNVMLFESDCVCTGLQLANFAQDMGEDLARGRRYAPSSWQLDIKNDREAPVLKMADWAQKKIDAGSGLASRIRTSNHPNRLRLGLEIALVIEGGREIIRIVRADPAAVWRQPPSIPKHRLPLILLRAIRTLFARPNPT